MNCALPFFKLLFICHGTICHSLWVNLYRNESLILTEKVEHFFASPYEFFVVPPLPFGFLQMPDMRF